MNRLSAHLAILWVAVTLTAGPVLAQQASISPTHLAAARDVAIGSGITRTFDAIAPQLNEEIKQSALTRPDLSKDLNEVIKGLKPEMEQQKQRIVDTTARIFATRLTEAELKEIAAFFKSPAGSKYVQSQPLVIDELAREIETWTQGLAEYIMTRVRAELGKRGYQLQ